MRFSNVQILRAVAALMIVVYHCGIEMPEIAAQTGRVWSLDFTSFGAGVPLFFAISGFIMVTTSRGFGSLTGAADFMRRRIVRIVPLYWAVTTAALCAAIAAPQLFKVSLADTGYLAGSFLFWPAMRITGEIRPLATPGWTLNLEMMFYAVFAVSMLLPRRAGLAATFAVLGALVLARLAGLLAGVPAMFWSDPIILGFLAGMALALLRESGLALTAREAGMTTALGALMLFHPRMTGLEETDLLPRVLDAIPCAIVLAGATLGPQIGEKTLLARLLVPIGDASYSLYLTHEFLLRAMRMAWTKLLGAAAPVSLYLPAGIIAATVLALLVYSCFERPVTRRLSRPWFPPRGRESYGDRVRAALVRT